MSQAFHPIVPFHLIQGIRLVHALMESRFDICIPLDEVYKFATLKERFNANFREGVQDAVKVDKFCVIHTKPSTSIGKLERFLVFPHAIVRYCRSLWAVERDVPVSFAGLLTSCRKEVVSNYCEDNFPSSLKMLPNLNPPFFRMLNKIRRSLGREPKSYSMQVGALTLWSSSRGRVFPIKAWDQEYYELLARSRFVLCPDGDYVWTYRFFESVLCGAIPVVEQVCPAYEGFVFHNVHDKLDKLKWTEDIAQHNYELCAKRITIPFDEMNSELELILS